MTPENAAQLQARGQRALLEARKAEEADIQRRAAERDLEDALEAAQLAISEYHNGDREWAARWLLQSHKANGGE